MPITRTSPWGSPETPWECAFQYGFSLGLIGCWQDHNPFAPGSEEHEAFTEGNDEAAYRKRMDKHTGFLGGIAQLSTR